MIRAVHAQRGRSAPAFHVLLLAIAGATLLFVRGATPARAQSDRPVRHFTTQDGLPHERLSALAQSPDGRLWVGTLTGLAVYDGHQFTSVSMPDSLRNASIGALLPTPDGSMWAALPGWPGLVQIRHQRVVRARMGDKTGPPATLPFVIAPFFYETWWFRGLCVLGVLG